MGGKSRIYVISGVVLAVLIAAFCAIRGVSRRGDGASAAREVPDSVAVIPYKAVPADAVVIMDFGRLGDFLPVVSDTSVFGYGLVDLSSPLVRFQNGMEARGAAPDCHTLFSIHYSSLNEISFMQITDLGRSGEAAAKVREILDSKPRRSRQYNGCALWEFGDGLCAAICGRLLIASNSAICVESALRHVANGSSILDDSEFHGVFEEFGGPGHLYVNHRQIGKIFSGSVTYGFLKYADFMMRYATWSVLDINPRQKNIISFRGTTCNNRDAINFSTVYGSQSPAESGAGKILPASTVFGVALQIPSMKSYLKGYQNYLEVNKKLSSYLAAQERVAIPGEETPSEWILSAGFSEVVSAFCLIGSKYEWITLAYRRSSLFKRVASGVRNQMEHPEVLDFKYKGYIGSVLGELFTHCSEESFCTIGEWTIIGSKRAVTEFASGKANAVKLGGYLSHTPVSSFLDEKGNAKVFVNLKEGADTLLTVFNRYFRGRFEESLKHKNFEYLTINVTTSGRNSIADMSYYSAKLPAVPEMFDPQISGVQFFVDSTIKPDFGPFTLVDPQTGDTTYLTQSKKWLSISLSDRKKRNLWGIPFKDTIRGMAGQAVLADNRTYMAFIISDKLHLMSKRGGYAGGYPKRLDVGVALGPKVIKEEDGYRMFVLDTDNVVRKLDLNGAPVHGWTDIHAPEFTHSLPETEEFFGEKYLVLRTVAATRIYRPDGTEIVSKNARRLISKESPLVQYEKDYLKVMGTDGKEFLFNIRNGKIKKL